MNDTKIIDEAIEPVRTGLQADGYDLHVESNGDNVTFRIVAGPQACEECLIPVSVMRPMIATMLEEASVRVAEWDLEYPSG